MEYDLFGEEDSCAQITKQNKMLRDIITAHPAFSSNKEAVWQLLQEHAYDHGTKNDDKTNSGDIDAEASQDTKKPTNGEIKELDAKLRKQSKVTTGLLRKIEENEKNNKHLREKLTKSDGILRNLKEHYKEAIELERDFIKQLTAAKRSIAPTSDDELGDSASDDGRKEDLSDPVLDLAHQKSRINKVFASHVQPIKKAARSMDGDPNFVRKAREKAKVLDHYAALLQEALDNVDAGDRGQERPTGGGGNSGAPAAAAAAPAAAAASDSTAAPTDRETDSKKARTATYNGDSSTGNANGTRAKAAAAPPGNRNLGSGPLSASIASATARLRPTPRCPRSNSQSSENRRDRERSPPPR